MNPTKPSSIHQLKLSLPDHKTWSHFDLCLGFPSFPSKGVQSRLSKWFQTEEEHTASCWEIL